MPRAIDGGRMSRTRLPAGSPPRPSSYPGMTWQRPITNDSGNRAASAPAAAGGGGHRANEPRRNEQERNATLPPFGWLGGAARPPSPASRDGTGPLVCAWP